MIPGVKRPADFLRTMLTRAFLMRNIGRDIDPILVRFLSCLP